MVEIVGIRFKNVGKIYYFNPCGMKFSEGDFAIVETARGVEYGKVSIANKQVEDSEILTPLKPVLRPATDEDKRVNEENLRKSKEAYEIGMEKINKHNLNMKLVEVEYTFDGSKILFYFTADGRVDFRELVKDLASVFRTRIELRQIGVRDEAKMLGGLGVCGRKLCCHSFLGEFIPVSIKMAKEQGLSLNPTKISGTCGRLMCCLKYEQDTYEDMGKDMPTVGSTVQTPDGKGYVISIMTLKHQVFVKFENSPVPKCYALEDITILKNARRQDDEEELEILKELEQD